MSFWIQRGNPRGTADFNLDDLTSLTDVLEALFMEETEDAMSATTAFRSK